MSPFVLFRMWARRAPLPNRVAAAVAAAVALALLVWIAVPSTNSTNSVATSGGNAFSPVAGGGNGGSTGPSAAGGGQAGAASAASPAGGAAGQGSTTGAVAAGQSPGTGAGSGPGAAGGAGGGAASPTGARSGASGSATGTQTAAGQTCSKRTPVKVGVVIPDVGSGSASLNSTFGIPGASEEEADFNAVFDSFNKAGGVACHTLVGDYQVFDETNATSAQTECLQFAQDKVFAVLGGWEPSTNDTCTLQHHIPTFEDQIIPASEVKQFYPYYFSDAGEIELLFHNFSRALANMGYFSAGKGFKKAGIFYRDCLAGEEQAMVAQLEQAGVPASAITSYDVGCPAAPFVPPSTVEAAILKFQQSGVTDVLPVSEYEDMQAFTRQANSQGYKPQYLVEDDGFVATSSSVTFSPDPTNFNGAVAITPYQYGAMQTGLPETAQTQKCDQILTSHGLPTVYKSGDQFGGVVCSLVWMLAAGIQNDASLNPAGLAAGLTQAGSVDLSYPDGPNDLRASGGTYGGEFWRPLQFQAGCSCWKVTNPTFSPSFP